MTTQKVYSKKFLDYTKDAIFKYQGYPVDWNNNPQNVLLKYNVGGLVQYANVPKELYNKLKAEKKKPETAIIDYKKIIDDAKNEKKRLNKLIEKIKTLTMKVKDIYGSIQLSDKVFIIRQTNKKLWQGEAINKMIHVQHTPITQSTIPYLTSNVFEIVKQALNIATSKYKGGFNIYIKLHTTDYVKKKHFKFVVRSNNNITAMDIKRQFIAITEKNYDTADYILYLNVIEIIVSSLGVKGGCCKSEYKSHREKKKNEKDKVIILKSYKSTNNNCLIQCYNVAYGVKGNEMKPEEVRKQLKIKTNEKINIDMIPTITEFYNTKYKLNKGYQLLNQKFEIISFKYFDNAEDYIKLYLRDDHYFLFEVVEFKNCDKCGRKLKADNTKHVCNIKMITHKHMREGKKDYVQVRDIIEKEKINYDNVIHWDLETFQDTTSHIPYASGWYNNGYKTVYGKDCMNKTVDEFIGYENKIISAYNGAGFDFYFLLDKLTERNIKIDKVILSNGRLISFQYGNNNKVFDLCLFLTCSLKNACDDFKILNKKSTFNHELMKSWADVEKYRKEVEPYLTRDVEALKELFETFNDMMYSLIKANITSYVSTGHMAYSIWSSMLKHLIEVPNDLEKYKFIKRGTYGARCYPQQKKYESESFIKLRDQYKGKKLYDKLKESKDFIFNADASSLYPASMRGFDLMKVKYPINVSRWSDKTKEDFENGKIGLYEIKYIPPADIRVPILPNKKYDSNNVYTGIEWTLLSNTGVYTSVDIENAIDAGYKIEFINKALVWDETAEIFNTYVDMFYKMKETAEKEKNDVKRNCAKLFLNSLYGKTLQKAIFNNTKIINDVFEFNTFVREYSLTDFTILNENKLLVSGDAKEQKTKINKPCQLGAFVLAYSRRVMLTYMKAIDPTLKTCTFTYSDTDSIHILGKDYEKLLKLGYIKTKANAKLGYLCSDIKEEGIIFNEINLAPKTYMYEYINQLGDIKENESATFKCKGIPKRCLKSALYKEELKEELSFTGLKKKHKTLTKSDVEQGIKNFSIVNSTQTRTFNKSDWKGMQLIDNQFYPKGYKNNLL